jgi:hypothetical protein
MARLYPLRILTHIFNPYAKKIKKWFENLVCQYFGCSKQFESLTSLCIHKRMVHGSQSWSCDLCDQNFRDEQSFADHTIDHPTIDPLLLPIECAAPEEVNVKIEELQLF